MIVKDESETIACILADAASFCDELVVVDTGSSDDTPRIAKAAGARVVSMPWDDDFAAARNASLEVCTGDWVVWADADDRIPRSSQQEFRRVIEELDDDLDVVLAPYHMGFGEDGRCLQQTMRERIFRRRSGLRWVCAIHEHLNYNTTTRIRKEPALVVEHRPTERKLCRDPRRNLRILQGLYAAGDRSGRTLYYRAGEIRQSDHHDLEAAVAASREAVEELRKDQSDCTCPAARTACTPAWMYYNTLVALSELLTARGCYAEALDSALQAIQLDATRPEAWMTAGITHFNQENWSCAAPFFGGALQATWQSDARRFASEYLSACLKNRGSQEASLPGK
ncbi:glycosyltransferase [Streptomyces sp. NPDC086787]|uniref:glycosyltransferase n=1 Tax=Streptomyces sp. NPDC086787 TaxID=3365759 RepID=UPI0037F6C783